MVNIVAVCVGRDVVVVAEVWRIVVVGGRAVRERDLPNWVTLLQ